jgi:hypothetical protein
VLQVVKSPVFGIFKDSYIFQNIERIVRLPNLVSVFARPNFVFVNTQKYQDEPSRNSI